MKRLAIALVLASSMALGQGAALVVELGKTIEVDVGRATGWMCDDPSLVEAGVVTHGDHNIWRIAGKKVGSTLCRVGTDPFLPSTVVELHVVPAQGR